MTISDDKLKYLVHTIVDTAHPEKVILFGSAARGEDGRYSDIDVAVVVPAGIHRRQTERHIYRAMIGFKIPVDVVVITQSDLDNYGNSPGLLYRDILKEGTLLYAA